MTKYPMFYIVRFWDEDENTTKTERGIGFAASHSDAADQLEKYYGIMNIDSMTIHLMEENYIMPLSEELWKLCFAHAQGAELK